MTHCERVDIIYELFYMIFLSYIEHKIFSYVTICVAVQTSDIEDKKLYSTTAVFWQWFNACLNIILTDIQIFISMCNQK